MHELSLAEAIVRMALDAPPATAGNLRGLTVCVGALSSVSIDTLEFCMGLAIEQRGMQHVKVRIRKVPARVRCACGHECESESLFEGCPECGGFDREGLEGRDVTLESIEVEDGEDQREPLGAEQQR